MNIEELKEKIETTGTVLKLMKIGEKLFEKSDDAVCAVTYLIERAYILGKENKAKVTNKNENKKEQWLTIIRLKRKNEVCAFS